jgi:hypothetical protein
MWMVIAISLSTWKTVPGLVYALSVVRMCIVRALSSFWRTNGMLAWILDWSSVLL